MTIHRLSAVNVDYISLLYIRGDFRSCNVTLGNMIFSKRESVLCSGAVHI
jgi:hypothetical protein